MLNIVYLKTLTIRKILFWKDDDDVYVSLLGKMLGRAKNKCLT